MTDWNAIISGASACGGSEFDNRCEAAPKGLVEVVVEQHKASEIYVVHISIDGERVSHEIMPGGASGKAFADTEALQATELYARHGYKVISSSINS